MVLPGGGSERQRAYYDPPLGAECQICLKMPPKPELARVQGTLDKPDIVRSVQEMSGLSERLFLTLQHMCDILEKTKKESP